MESRATRSRRDRRLYVFGGPNGAGKTTLSRRLVRGRIPIVNPDEMVNASLASPDAQRLDAGRKAVLERRRLLAIGATFAIETTLTGNSEAQFVVQAQAQGYRVTLVFLGLADLQLSVARVADRVLGGGHDIPLDDLVRRFGRSQAGLYRLAPTVDRLAVIDNSESSRRILFWRDGTQVRRVSDDIPDWAREALRSDSVFRSIELASS